MDIKNLNKAPKFKDVHTLPPPEQEVVTEVPKFKDIHTLPPPSPKPQPAPKFKDVHTLPPVEVIKPIPNKPIVFNSSTNKTPSYYSDLLMPKKNTSGNKKTPKSKWGQGR